MRKFLNLTIMLMILFISISTAGCGAKDDYIEGYGEDEYIEYSDSEYYEEPQEYSISDKEINKILKKYPDFRTQPEAFAKKALIGEIENIDRVIAESIERIINSDLSYRQIRYDIDPTRIIIFREDQNDEKLKIDRQYIMIRQYNSVYEFSHEKQKSTIVPVLESMNINTYGFLNIYHTKYIFKFYQITFIEMKKNGKEKIYSDGLYLPGKLRFDNNYLKLEDYDFGGLLVGNFLKYIDWTYKGIKP